MALFGNQSAWFWGSCDRSHWLVEVLEVSECSAWGVYASASNWDWRSACGWKADSQCPLGFGGSVSYPVGRISVCAVLIWGAGVY